MRMVGYGRVSTDHEEQRDSLEHQQAFFQDFARARGHTLVRVYSDQGISGKWLKKRDGFLQMLRDAERGEFELVVVKDISRFARNTVDSLESIRRLKALGIECIFVNNSLKVLGESEFIVTIMAAIAQEESANLSKRVKFGKDITSRKGGCPPASTATTGWTTSPSGSSRRRRRWCGRSSASTSRAWAAGRSPRLWRSGGRPPNWGPAGTAAGCAASWKIPSTAVIMSTTNTP